MVQGQGRALGCGLRQRRLTAKTMPARTRKIRHDDETRAKIQAAQLINRLQGCVMGTVELTSTQVRAAETLLRKVLPDLSATELTGEVQTTYVARLPEVAPTVEAWQQQTQTLQ